jgi:uncharacterized protein (TIGR02453 family)
MLQPSTLKFLKDLKINNNRPWFEKNKNAYLSAKEDFENFVDKILEKYSKTDPGLTGLKAKDCVFRIYRDVRFSKDKSPYKSNMGASMTKGGRKSPLAGYYFHIEHGGNSMIGGGIWMPQPEAIKKVRQEIDYNYKSFKKIIHSKKFRASYGDLYREEGIALTRPPKEYDQDNPAIEYLKLKSWIVLRNFKDSDLTSKLLLKNVTDAMATLKPLINFINQAIEE